jgi:hypothetical protein
MAAPVQATYGFLGFFDILGYRQLLERNEIPTVIEVLRSKVGSLPTFTDRIFGRPLAEFKNERASEVLRSLQWLSFADSILLTMPVMHKEAPGIVSPGATATGEIEPALEAGLFFFVATRLIFEMFSSGLPLRGAIHVGDFHVAPPFFAGASITEAYELTMKQEWTGCALTAAAAERVTTLFRGENHDWLELSLPRYDIPVKGGATIASRAVNWGFWAPWNYRHVTGVLREAVIESFLKHKKTLSEKEFLKVTNTEVFLNYCKINARNSHPEPWQPLSGFV